MGNALLTAPTTDFLINNFKGIQSALAKQPGKLTHADMLALFMENENFSEKARLLASEIVDGAFSGYSLTSSFVSPFTVSMIMDVLIVRARKGTYDNQ